jgi:hypothetical protein
MGSFVITFLNLGLSLGLFGVTLLLFGVAVPPLVDRLALHLTLGLAAPPSSPPLWSCSRS